MATSKRLIHKQPAHTLHARFDEADEEVFPETESEFVSALQRDAPPGTVVYEHDDVITNEHPLTDGVLSGRVNVVDSTTAPASRVHLNNFVDSDDSCDDDAGSPELELEPQSCTDATFDDIQPFDG